MQVQAVIEICSQPDGDFPFELVRQAYSASRRGTIIFILRGVSPAAIDQALDALVRELPLSLPGVLYVDAENYEAVKDAILATNAIFYSTDEFKASVADLDPNARTIRPVELAPHLLN
jgi:hypothetical protein